MVTNIIEIDSLGEDMERITLKDSPTHEDKSKVAGESEVQEV